MVSKNLLLNACIFKLNDYFMNNEYNIKGLLEKEMLELLSPPGEFRLPLAVWSRLYRSLAEYLLPQVCIYIYFNYIYKI